MTNSSRKSFVAAGLLALLAANLHAQITTVWNPGGNPSSTGKWSEGANWSGGVEAGAGNKVVFNVGAAATCVVDSAATCGYYVLGDGGPAPGDSSLRIANGGSLTIANNSFSAIGYSRNASLEVQSGGSMTVFQLWVGLLTPSVGTFTMSGGTVTVTDMFGLGWDTGTGFAHINGGTLNLNAWHDTQSVKGSSILDIAGGTVIINGNRTTSVNTFIANGRITANGGSGTVVVDYNNTNPGKTTLTASGGVVTPAGKINSIEVSDGNVTIKYQTAPGSAYHLEQSAGIAPTAWSTVSGSTVGSAAGTQETYTFPLPGNEPYYFRSVSP